MFTKVLIFVIQFQNVATGSAILSNLNKSILFNSKQTHALPNNVRWPMSRLSKMDWSLRSAEPAPMRWVKCLPCLTWDWWQVTSEKRCCLIPSGYGNSHLLLTTINTAGLNTVSAAEHSYCTMKSFWIFVFVSATSWSSLVIRSQHVCRAAEFWQRMLANRHFKHAQVPTWWTVPSISTGMIKSALLTGCWKRVAYTDLQLVSDVTVNMSQQPLKYQCK